MLFGHTSWPFKRFATHFPVVTTILLLQTALFLISMLSGGWSDKLVLVHFGAYTYFGVATGEWWRLITPVFLHMDLIHFLFNSFALYIFGPQLEWMLGRFLFSLGYLLTGIAGNLFTYLLAPSVHMSVGASGSIYGLLGIYMYLYFFRKGLLHPDVGKGLFALVVINLVFSMLWPQINLAAHLGGFIGGMLLGAPLFAARLRTRN